MKKRLVILLLAALLVTNSSTTAIAAESPAAAASPEPSLFTDMSADRWSYRYVADLVGKGVVTGVPGGSFQPSRSITYGETFKLILTAIGVPEPKPGAEPEPETGPDAEPEPIRHWAWPYIQPALDNRLVYFFNEDALNEVPTRLEVARMVARALDLTDISGDSPFADCDDGYVVELYEKGVIEGVVDWTGTRRFYPDSPFTREELAVSVWRMMNTDVTSGMFRYSNYWLDTLDGVPLTSFSEHQFYLDEEDRVSWTGGYFTRGVDVSGHKRDIDWEAVAGDGIDFAIIRAGGRFYGRDGSGDVYEDSYFDQNMQGAIDAGLAVGAYFFSNAVTVEEAIEEADLLLSRLEPYRAYVTYPVVCDWEYLGGNNSRAYGVDAKVITQCVDAFCRRVEEAGYTPMLYFNEYCGYVKMDLSQLTRYQFWYAEYAGSPKFRYDFQMWQYSSSGKVAGISSGVDMDLCFVPFGRGRYN